MADSVPLTPQQIVAFDAWKQTRPGTVIIEGFPVSQTEVLMKAITYAQQVAFMAGWEAVSKGDCL